MTPYTVVAFLGRAGTGKTTAAKHLIDNYGAKKISFAAPLKAAARDIFEFSAEQVYGSQATKETVDPRYGFSPRVAMQRLGEAMRQHVGENVWVDPLYATIIREVELGNQLLVIDDCRHPNEAEMLSLLRNGYVFKLECPNAQTGADSTHASETGVDKVDPEHITKVITSVVTPNSVDLISKVEEALNEFGIKEYRQV